MSATDTTCCNCCTMVSSLLRSIVSIVRSRTMSYKNCNLVLDFCNASVCASTRFCKVPYIDAIASDILFNVCASTPSSSCSCGSTLQVKSPWPIRCAARVNSLNGCSTLLRNQCRTTAARNTVVKSAKICTMRNKRTLCSASC